MKIRYLAIGSLLAMAISCPAAASVFSDDLGRCVVNATTEPDRHILMRWMFLVAAANPAFADLTSISDTERREGDRAIALVYDRLLLRACRRETIEALRNDGPAGIEAGFQALGLLAGRELVSSPESAVVLRRLASLMDLTGLEALMREAGIPGADAAVPTP